MNYDSLRTNDAQGTVLRKYLSDFHNSAKDKATNKALALHFYISRAVSVMKKQL